MGKPRMLRVVGSTAPDTRYRVPWGTAANPGNLPRPRTLEEWQQAAIPCSNEDAHRIRDAISRYPSVVDVLGDGYSSARELSDYAAWMTLGVIDLHRALMDASEERRKRDLLNVAGSHYKAHPVQPCSECAQETPHSNVNDSTLMCLVCGDRSYL